MITKSWILWKEIIQKRNFDEKYYDIKESEFIRKKLNIPTDKSIYMGLKTKTISIEDFFKVFFEANSSFTAMMNDLLNMFEEIEAKETDNKLEISFEFEKDTPYIIDLDNFKSQIKKWELIEKEIIMPSAPNLNDYFYFNSELRSLNFPGRIDSEIIDYNKFKIDFFKTKNFKMNSLLDKLEFFLIELVCEIKKFGYDKQSLDKNFNKNDYIKLGIDNIPWLIADGVKRLSESFDCLGGEHQNKCLTQLEKFINKSGFKKQTIQERLEVVEEFLDLPFWKKRHELYSVWTFTLIYDVIKKYKYKIHVIDGKLIFPFKETHLATIYQEENKNIYIYCEKKTPLSNPVGKGRKGNIQPDYSFFVEPLSDINSSILEIECKQYKKQSSDNFARALIDYSKGRPKSKVLLVNHGEVNYENVKKKANIIVNDFEKERCEVFGNIVANSIGKDKLKEYIENILFKKNIFLKKSKIKAKLTWGEKPQDLDLSCNYEGSNQYTINYQNQSLDNITFKEDVTTGYGPEEIEFSVFESSKFNFLVQDFHSTSELKNSNAKVEFFLNEKLIKDFEVNENFNEENIWNVCSVNISKINKDEYEMNFELLDEPI